MSAPGATFVAPVSAGEDGVPGGWDKDRRLAQRRSE
jgi:hypothetical protein